MSNLSTLSDYERYKREAEMRVDARLAAKRKAVIEKKQYLADIAERMANHWFFITPGEVLKTNVGIIKVSKINNLTVTTTYGKTYTATQLFGSDIAKIIKERMKLNGRSKW